MLPWIGVLTREVASPWRLEVVGSCHAATYSSLGMREALAWPDLFLQLLVVPQHVIARGLTVAAEMLRLPAAVVAAMLTWPAAGSFAVAVAKLR